MSEKLAFVVAGPSSVNSSVPNLGLKGRCLPGFQGFRRLNVEMTVDEQRSFRSRNIQATVYEGWIVWSSHGHDLAMETDGTDVLY